MEPKCNALELLEHENTTGRVLANFLVRSTLLDLMLLQALLICFQHTAVHLLLLCHAFRSLHGTLQIGSLDWSLP